MNKLNKLTFLQVKLTNAKQNKHLEKLKLMLQMPLLLKLLNIYLNVNLNSQMHKLPENNPHKINL